MLRAGSLGKVAGGNRQAGAIEPRSYGVVAVAITASGPSCGKHAAVQPL
jgi:hypothetical protein